MNIVVLVGRLAQDPVLKTTNNGHNVCTFSVAVDRRFKSPGQPDVDFFNVVAWNRQAEVICQYLSKGRQIALSGRLQTRSYQAKDGTNRYVTEVVLDSFDFIGSRNDTGYNASYDSYQPQPQQPKAPEASAPLEIDDDFSLLADDDEVPF